MSKLDEKTVELGVARATLYRYVGPNGGYFIEFF